ncbi:MAG: hypothetical protein JRC68_05500 [Deltaproteobacteria bacterium]|nr:hypothetical protein [Deltaproteobacteria bacterium]
MKDKIIGLIKLQDCDSRIKEVIAGKKEGPLKIQELENELKTSLMRLQEENDRFEQLKKDRRGIEQDVREIESKLEKSSIKLNNVKSNKEYKAALKEIEDLNKSKSMMEDRIIQIMEDIEALEKGCLENRDVQVELNRKFEMDKEEIEKKLEKLDNKFKDLEKQRAEFCRVIDKDLLSRYQFLKERKGGSAISPVIDGVCQTCHMGIPPQQFNNLIKGYSLLTCPNCSRMIYWGEDSHYQDVKNA